MRTVRNRWQQVCVWSGVASVVAACSVSAAGADPVTWTPGYALGDSHQFTVQGAPDGTGGCVMPSGKMKLPSGQSAIEQREIALDPATCAATFEEGVPPADEVTGDALRETPATGYGSTAQANVRAPSATAQAARVRHRVVAHAASYIYTSGQEKDWWEDPAGIDVNKTISHVSFYYGGGCVHNPVNWWGEWFWYTTSGWSLVSNSNYGDASCSLAYSSSWGHMHNWAFCAAWVDSYYDRTIVNGNPDGGLWASWNSYNTGAWCKSLLSFHRSLSRTS
jgi:hypothetical protein